MKNENLFLINNIPNNWSVKKVKHIFDERKEFNDPIKTNVLISLTHNKGVILHSEKEGNIGNREKNDLRKYKLVYPGDIVVNSMNVIIGSSGLSNHYGLVSPVYYMLKFKNEKYDKKYFHYLFRSVIFQKSLIGLGNGILEHRMRIPMEKLGSHKIPVPPFDLQKKISFFLDKKINNIDLLKKKISEKIKLLKEFKISLINELIFKGHDNSNPMKKSEIKWIDKIPKHWEEKKISTMYSQVSEKGHSNEQNLSVFRDYGVVRREDYENKNVLSDDLSNYKLVIKGDLVLNKMKTWMGSLGISDYRGIVSPAYYVLRPKKSVYDRYLHLLLRSKVYIDKYASLSKGIRPGQWDLGIDDFKSLKIPVPPINEQKKIIDILYDKIFKLDKLIEIENIRLEKILEYSDAIISSSVSGKKIKNI